MSDCGFNVWTDLVIPVIISPILLFAKILYDKWSNKKSKTLLLKNKLKLEKIKNQLEKFYWPLYIRLLRDFDIWSRFAIYDKDFYNFIESDTDSDIEDSENIKRCNYIYKSRDINGNFKYKNCNIPVHINSKNKGPLFCLRHHKYSNLYNIEIIDYSNPDTCNKEVKQLDIVINRDNKGEKRQEIINSEIKNDENIIDNIPGNITGNNIGEIKELDNFNSNNQINIDEDIYKSLVKTLIENYNEINKLIINNISIAEPNTQIGKQLIRFMKFALIIKALIKSDRNIDPNKYDSPYPKKLLPIVEKKVFKLQKKYNDLVNNFYFK